MSLGTTQQGLVESTSVDDKITMNVDVTEDKKIATINFSDQYPGVYLDGLIGEYEGGRKGKLIIKKINNKIEGKYQADNHSFEKLNNQATNVDETFFLLSKSNQDKDFYIKFRLLGADEKTEIETNHGNYIVADREPNAYTYTINEQDLIKRLNAGQKDSHGYIKLMKLKTTSSYIGSDIFQEQEIKAVVGTVKISQDGVVRIKFTDEEIKSIGALNNGNNFSGVTHFSMFDGTQIKFSMVVKGQNTVVEKKTIELVEDSAVYTKTIDTLVNNNAHGVRFNKRSDENDYIRWSYTENGQLTASLKNGQRAVQLLKEGEKKTFKVKTLLEDKTLVEHEVKVIGKKDNIDGPREIKWTEDAPTNMSAQFKSTSEHVYIKAAKLDFVSLEETQGEGVSSVRNAALIDKIKADLHNIIKITGMGTDRVVCDLNNLSSIQSLGHQEKLTLKVTLTNEEGVEYESTLVINGASDVIRVVEEETYPGPVTGGHTEEGQTVGAATALSGKIELYESGLPGGTMVDVDEAEHRAILGTKTFQLAGGNAYFDVKIEAGRPVKLGCKTIEWKLSAPGATTYIGVVDGKNVLEAKLDHNKVTNKVTVSLKLLQAIQSNQSNDYSLESTLDMLITSKDAPVYRQTIRFAIVDDNPEMFTSTLNKKELSKLLEKGRLGELGADGGYISELKLGKLVAGGQFLPQLSIHFDGDKVHLTAAQLKGIHLYENIPTNILIGHENVEVTLRVMDGHKELVIQKSNDETSSFKIDLNSASYQAENFQYYIRATLRDSEGDTESKTYRPADSKSVAVNGNQENQVQPNPVGQVNNGEASSTGGSQNSGDVVEKEHFGTLNHDAFIFNPGERDHLIYKRNECGLYSVDKQKTPDSIVGFSSVDKDVVDFSQYYKNWNKSAVKEYIVLSVEGEQLFLTAMDGNYCVAQRVLFKDWHQSADYQSFTRSNELSHSPESMQALLDKMLEKELILI